MPVLEQVEVDWSLDEETQREFALWQEGDEAVGNSYGLWLVRILYEALIASYLPPPHPDGRGGKRPFWVDFEVGVVGPAGTRRFLVPDLFLSLDIERPVKVAMYKLSAAAKPPELVVEVVSETPGGELEHKLEIYASWGIQYYLVFDWAGWLGEELAIHAFSLENGRYVRLEEPYFPKLGLGVRLWRGCFEDDREQVYMRFCDESGEVLATKDEKRMQDARRADEATALSKRDRRVAERERMLAERERIHAEQEKANAAKEKARADHLSIRLEEERARTDQEKARADAEAHARQLAEAEVRELRKRLEDMARNS